MQNPRFAPLPSAVGSTPFRSADLLSEPIPRDVRMPAGYPSPMVEDAGPDDIQPFRVEGRELMRREVMGRLLGTKMSDRLLRIGGYRNQIPKPQPTGTFQRPLNTSGNQDFGASTLAGAGYTGGGGSFRTQAGSRLGIELLRKRGQQFEVLDQLQPFITASQQEGLPSTDVVDSMTRQQQGTELPEGVAPVPLTQEQSQEFGLDIIFNAIRESAAVGEFSGLGTEDMRRAFQNLAGRVGLAVGLDDLNRYKQITDDAYEAAKGVIFDPTRVTRTRSRRERLRTISTTTPRTTRGLPTIASTSVEERYGMNTSKYSALWRLRELLVALISSFYLQPRQRGIRVRGEAKRILKESPPMPEGPTEEEDVRTRIEAASRAREGVTRPISELETSVRRTASASAAEVGERSRAEAERIGRMLRTPGIARDAAAEASAIEQTANEDQQEAMFGEPLGVAIPTDEAEEAAAAPVTPVARITRRGRRTRTEEATPAPVSAPINPQPDTGARTLPVRESFVDQFGVVGRQVPLGELQRPEVTERIRRLAAARAAEEQQAPDVADPARAATLAQASVRAAQNDAVRPSGAAARTGLDDVQPAAAVTSAERLAEREENIRFTTDGVRQVSSQELRGLRVPALRQRAREAGFPPQMVNMARRERLIEMITTGRGVSGGAMSPEMRKPIQGLLGLMGYKKKGAGRPTQYKTPEDKLNARRVANQVLRKKKDAYKKSYDKAIAEGLAGPELDERAKQVFAEFGFKPSDAFPFGGFE